MRQAQVTRKTRETSISLSLTVDGNGECSVKTGIPFFDHMLDAFARHGHFNLTLLAEGDLEVDGHHTVEDTGIVIGKAIRELVGDGRGIRRFAHAIVPMDESLASVALDVGGRPYLEFQVPFTGRSLGGMEVDMVSHFFSSLCTHAGITAHIRAEGRNDHHRCEAVFKAFGIALDGALSHYGNPDRVPSTKGEF